MAQITYTKLGIKPVVDEVKIIDWAPEIKIEVRQYLPLQKKLEVLTNIINASTDDNGFYNSAKIDFNQTLEIIFAYTNIKFTDKQKEDPMKLYDSFYSSGLAKEIFHLIPERELNWFDKHTRISIDKIYEYRNSVYGILVALKNDYDDLGLDVDKLREQLAKDDNVEFLKEVVDKLV
jgi:hypothetical protein